MKRNVDPEAVVILVLHEMDFSDDRYYKLNRIFLSSIGLWPHRYITLRQIQGILSSFILISVTSPQLIKLITTKYDVDIVLRILSSALPFMLFTVKYITFYFVVEEAKALMRRIQNDWNVLRDSHEFEIIHRYAKMAKLFTTSLATLIYVSTFTVIVIQYVPTFLNIVAPRNKSRQAELLFLVEYFVDQKKYYHAIQFHLVVGLIVAAMTILSTESFCLVLAIHAFGMFKIARFSDILKTTFAIPYLALILLGVTSTSVNLFLLFQVFMTSSTLNDVLRSIVFVICHFIYMFSTNYAGQKFIDHDVDVYEKICNVRWYNAPLRIQKEILFIMQKTIRSYRMDVGGLYSPSLQGFTSLASASLSYFTVLCSMQK